LHEYSVPKDAPVIQVEVTKVERMTNNITKYEFQSLDKSDLPEWKAGSHIDIVVVPEFLRQYSMSGNPADRSKYQIGVLLEKQGRGGSKMLHRIFNKGRKIFISKPINHFELDEQANNVYLMGGGIGITPMISFAHRLHSLKRNFIMHYSSSKFQDAGFINDLNSFEWKNKVKMYFSDQNLRADFNKIFKNFESGSQVYICGSDRYMNAVKKAAIKNGVKEDLMHFEYFSLPEEPDYINHNFILKLSKSDKEFEIPANRSSTDILKENGFNVDVKCSDGICGVCKCGLVSGEVEHRDFVLSKKMREDSIILCKSRAAKNGGKIVIDL